MCRGAQQDPCPARVALRVNLIVAGLFQKFSRGANVRERREMLAGSTGLEPAASGVTGRRSNQLNYDPVLTMILQIADLRLQIEFQTRLASASNPDSEQSAICQFRSAMSECHEWAVQDSNL